MRSAIDHAANSRPRLWLAAGVMAVVVVLPPYALSITTRLLAAWSVGTAVYLALVLRLMFNADAEQTRERSAREDPNRGTLDAILLSASAASLVGVFLALVDAGQAKSAADYAKIGLAIATAALAWLLTHTLYAMHYARLYYHDDAGEPAGGLDFHCDDPPDYQDFFYFAIAVACTFGATDVAVTGRHIRRTLTSHALLSFAYGTINLALAVNVVTNLLSKS